MARIPSLAARIAPLLVAALAVVPADAPRAASADPVSLLPDPSQAEPETLLPLPAPEPAERHLAEGMASYYGKAFAGKRTASGEAFDPSDLTAAHRTLPFGSRVRVTDLSSGRSVVVRINDRGPFTRGRLIDVSQAAAHELNLIRRGHGMVRISLLD